MKKKDKDNSEAKKELIDSIMNDVSNLSDENNPDGDKTFVAADSSRSIKKKQKSKQDEVQDSPSKVSSNEDKTTTIATGTTTVNTDDDENTIAVMGVMRPQEDVQPEKVKVSYGGARSTPKISVNSGDPMAVHSSPEVTLLQAENLRIAQQRILDLENEVDRLRLENEELASAGDILKNKNEELKAKIEKVESLKTESETSSQSEIDLLNESLKFKSSEMAQLQEKIEELELRLAQDFKKIRVRERELENRLELAKLEKTALMRSKDENILELKRRIDQLSAESESYRLKCQELNKQIEGDQDKFRRTVRALRLALSNLEISEETVVQLKKAD